MLALLQLYGFGAFTWFGESELGHRIVSACGTLLVTLLLALAAWEAANAAIQRHLAKLAEGPAVRAVGPAAHAAAAAALGAADHHRWCSPG